MARASTGELEVSTGLLSTGITLVAAVPAIVLPVALPRHRDASPVVATELRILAGHVNAPRLIWGNETNESNSSGFFPGMPAALIIGMWRWSGVVGCNLGRELDRTYGDHMAAHCTNALSTQMSPQSLSWCHLLPIDETSNGLWLIGQHRHIDVQTPRRPDNFESCCHIDRMMCPLPKRDKKK